MAVSGTYDFNLDIDQVIQEASEMIGGESTLGHEPESARRSINLMLKDWQNRGVLLWSTSTTTVTVVASTTSYSLDSSTINALEVVIGRSDTDVKLTRITPEEFMLIPNKTQTGKPNQYMLDNGVTFNSYIDVANCESTEGNCESKGGANDSHTTTIVLKDSSGNVLSTTTQTRTEVTGFQGNCNGYPATNSGGQTADCGQNNDQVIFNSHGSN